MFYIKNSPTGHVNTNWKWARYLGLTLVLQPFNRSKDCTLVPYYPRLFPAPEIEVQQRTESKIFSHWTTSTASGYYSWLGFLHLMKLKHFNNQNRCPREHFKNLSLNKDKTRNSWFWGRSRQINASLWALRVPSRGFVKSMLSLAIPFLSSHPHQPLLPKMGGIFLNKAL